MRRALWSRLLLLFGSLVVSFVLAEGILRLHYQITWTGSVEDLHTNPAMPAAGQRVLLGPMLRPSRHPNLVYELKPGLEVIFIWARVQTSPAGWREEPHPLARPENTIRILGIGDSTMFGWGVEVEQRYMDLLERRLQAELPGPNWQTIVTAVPGYNLVMELEVLEREGLAYEPDLIVYGWNPNDFNLPNFLLPKRDIWEPVSFVGEYLRGLGQQSPRLVATARIAEPREVPHEFRHLAGRPAFEGALGRLAELSTRRGIPTALITDFHLDFEAATGTAVPSELIYVETRSRARGIPRLELTRSQRDPHPNAAGHQLLADALWENLEEAGVWKELIGKLSEGRREAGP